MSKDNNTKPLISPLRYPGGKSFLCGYIERFLTHNNLHPRLFVEPFAGGASVSMHLLGKGLVDQVALYDLDLMVTSFWWAVFNDGKWLQNRVRRAEVTLDHWISQQKLSLDGHRTNAWKCLFLNRTSFSGILAKHAGPLGGKSQTSANKIDCRFYRNTIIQRLKELRAFRDQVVNVDCLDWRETIKRHEKLEGNDPNACLIYLDPPFFHKAEDLYNHHFSAKQHENLIAQLSTLQIPWLLSYDRCPEAIGLFRKYSLHYRTVPVRYTSGTQKKRNEKMELVSSNLPLPKGANP